MVRRAGGRGGGGVKRTQDAHSLRDALASQRRGPETVVNRPGFIGDLVS